MTACQAPPGFDGCPLTNGVRLSIVWANTPRGEMDRQRCPDAQGGRSLLLCPYTLNPLSPSSTSPPPLLPPPLLLLLLPSLPSLLPPPSPSPIPPPRLPLPSPGFATRMCNPDGLWSMLEDVTMCASYDFDSAFTTVSHTYKPHS